MKTRLLVITIASAALLSLTATPALAAFVGESCPIASIGTTMPSEAGGTLICRADAPNHAAWVAASPTGSTASTQPSQTQILTSSTPVVPSSPTAIISTGAAPVAQTSVPSATGIISTAPAPASPTGIISTALPVATVATPILVGNVGLTG